jgi:two-component system, sensor histidine kinase
VAHQAAGACFVLSLPLPAGSVLPTAADAPVPSTQLKGRVLVAEDNPVNAIVAVAMLERSGLEVEVVEDGQQAVHRASEQAFDLILMDCQMPGMDGFEATRLIRAAERAIGSRATTIVALTANALPSDRQRSLVAGMNDHLAKPFREQDLSKVLQRYLMQNAPAHELG